MFCLFAWKRVDLMVIFLKKSGMSQRFYASEWARSASGLQFVQVCVGQDVLNIKFW